MKETRGQDFDDDAEIAPTQSPIDNEPKSPNLFTIAKDRLWRIATVACTFYLVLGTLPLVGSVLLISMASSVLIIAVGLLLAGFESGAVELISLVAFGGAIVAGFTFFGGALILYPSLVLLGLGLGLLISSILQMGASAFVFKPIMGTPLQNYGVYKAVRHPMYSGLILSSFGLAGLTESPERAVASLCLYPILREQIKVEEQLLYETHGDAYRKYASDVKATIVPFLDGPSFFDSLFSTLE